MIASLSRTTVWVVALLLFAPAVAAQPPAGYRLDRDWLVQRSGWAASIRLDTETRRLVLDNGLIRREFFIDGTLATVGLENLATGEEVLRAVRPEARLVVDGEAHDIGGLVGQRNHAYLTEEWLGAMTPPENAWTLSAYTILEPEERFPWKRTRHHAPNAEWPPKGERVEFLLEPPVAAGLDGVTVTICYEIYDGIPALSKWLRVQNQGQEPIDVDAFTSEILAAVPYEDPVEFRDVPLTPPNIHVETDYAFGGFSIKNATKHTVHWRPDPQFKTQVNYLLQNPCLLEVAPEMGPDQTVKSGESFESFRAFELFYDATDRDRQGMALRQFYRTVAPWVTENPLTFHLVASDEDRVRRAIDQAADCGFEMVSLSFGSGLNMENPDPAYRARFAALQDYAESSGIHIGGYSLLSSRRVQPDSDNIVNPETGEPGGQTHGFCPALASPWGQNYFDQLYDFFGTTGFLQFTHDGSYPGDFDAATRLPLQKGLEDSQWVQWKIITDFYKWLRANGAYVRIPDYYYLSGANEAGMGYREVNWSLPRVQQQIHTRQNIYDGTWQKTPSMGWMFVPLTQYHGGGAAATIEPLDEHRDHYGLMLASNLGAGVQAVYRGVRLYDTEATRDTVRQWVDWYKEHREVLESDIIHGSSRRADGRGLDWLFHANPEGETKGMVVIYNPTERDIETKIPLNLYYTGIEGSATTHTSTGEKGPLTLDAWNRVQLPVALEAGGVYWATFE